MTHIHTREEKKKKDNKFAQTHGIIFLPEISLTKMDSILSGPTRMILNKIISFNEKNRSKICITKLLLNPYLAKGVKKLIMMISNLIWFSFLAINTRSFIHMEL